MNTIPSVGSTVRVTTKHRNIYYATAESQPFNFNTYEGTVVPKHKWNGDDTFSMTGDERLPIRNISLDCVVSLEILRGDSVAKKVRAFRVTSAGSQYIVTLAGNKYNCSCVGFQYRKTCKHVTGVAQKLKVA